MSLMSGLWNQTRCRAPFHQLMIGVASPSRQPARGAPVEQAVAECPVERRQTGLRALVDEVRLLLFRHRNCGMLAQLGI